MSTMLKEVYDALKEAGASEEKASAAAVAISAYQLDRGRLATKEDIAALKEDIARLERATKEDIAKLKEDIADLRTELRTTRAELVAEIERMGRVVIMWNVGTLIAVASVVFAILRFAGGSGS
ncbi:MAG TPA: hypothetical protein VHH94_05460 [Gammaproteobacteria bacterium]|jgi:hypothetical protein|nr:hypothetical protein [Gammaproteobacteria bacterium]